MGTDEGGAASAQREELAETTLTPCPLAKKGREAAGSIPLPQLAVPVPNAAKQHAHRTF